MIAVALAASGLPHLGWGLKKVGVAYNLRVTHTGEDIPTN